MMEGNGSPICRSDDGCEASAANEVIVSVVVPVYNACPLLPTSLARIRESSFKCFEIIVVDDNSSDESGAVAQRYADVVISQRPRGGPGKARNRGASVCKGSILLFLDADVLIPTHAISLIVEEMEQDPGLCALFGSYDAHPLHQDFFSRFKNLFHHYVHQHAKTEATTFWSGCGAVRKAAFMETGGFPKSYSYAIEDVALGYSLHKKGRRIKLIKELQVTHMKKWGFISVLKTDIVNRAIPWTRLAAERGLPADLNFKMADRVSGLLSCCMALTLVATWQLPYLIVPTLIFSALLLYLNRGLYRFFHRHGRAEFSICAIFFHWFYLFYSSLVFGLYFPLCCFRKFIGGLLKRFANSAKSGIQRQGKSP